MSKFDKGKYKPSLIYTSLLKEISKVREYGIEKYGSPEDWTTTDPYRHFDAAIRHIRAYISGEQIDAESTLHHLSHAASNIMFEIERLYRTAEAGFIDHGNAYSKKSKEMLTFGEYLMGKDK
jgi:hypothetical protein